MTAPQTTEERTQNTSFLRSLEVIRFRTFDHLRIDKLGRVNLITGRNNVGKSSLLEAIWLHTNSASAFHLRLTLLEREELARSGVAADEVRRAGLLGESGYEQEALDGLRNLFYGRHRIIDALDADDIEIGGIGHEDRTRIRIAFLGSDAPEEFNSNSYDLLTGEITAVEEQHWGTPYVIVSTRHAVDAFRADHLLLTSTRRRIQPRTEQPIFLKSQGMERSVIASLWDAVSLTDYEQSITEAMQIIEPRIQRISFVGNGDSAPGRIPLLRMDGEELPVSLASLGEGTGRVFQIALALGTTRRSLLLIDEVEVGLHYSVQPAIWRLIFETARKLDVQVFATTHSWDCIQAFQQAASESPEDGALIRLHRRGEDILATVFDENDLEVVTREGLEVR